MGLNYLHRLLGRLDPAAASRIAPRDTQKIIRAVEMRVLTGKPVDEIHRAGRRGLEGYDVTKIGLNPPRVCALRTNQRAHDTDDAIWLAG